MIKRPAKIDPEAQLFIDWLTAGLRKPGRNLSGLARALNRAAPQARKLLDGKRRIQAAELRAISEYIGEPVPVLGESDMAAIVEVVCSVGEGFWYESSVFSGTIPYTGAERVPVVPDQRFLGMTQYAAKMADDSMSKVLEKGSFAIYVPYRQARPKPMEGDLVACEIRRGKLFKPCILRMMQTKAGWELQSFSHATNGGRHPTIFRMEKDLKRGRDVGDESVDLVGLVIAKFAVLLPA